MAAGAHDGGGVCLLTGLAVVAGSYGLVRSGRGRGLDARAARVFARPLGVRADRIIGGATDLGSVYGVAGVAAALAAMGRRDVALDVAAGGAIAWSAAQLAKPLLRRERPYEIATAGTERLVAVPAGSSWPSGHAAVMGAAVTTLARRSSAPAAAALWALAGTIGLSRLYVGVHHLTDVIAGLGVGAVSAAVWSLVRGAVSGR